MSQHPLEKRLAIECASGTYSEIAKRFGVSRCAVAGIKHRAKSRQELPELVVQATLNELLYSDSAPSPFNSPWLKPLRVSNAK